MFCQLKLLQLNILQNFPYTGIPDSDEETSNIFLRKLKSPYFS